MRIWIVIAAVVLGAFSYQHLRHKAQLHEMQAQYKEQHKRFQGAYEALQEELSRTRSNVLLAAKNASESRTELRMALQSEEEWSATEVPDSIRRSLGADGM